MRRCPRPAAGLGPVGRLPRPPRLSLRSETLQPAELSVLVPTSSPLSHKCSAPHNFSSLDFLLNSDDSVEEALSSLLFVVTDISPGSYVRGQGA